MTPEKGLVCQFKNKLSTEPYPTLPPIKLINAKLKDLLEQTQKFYSKLKDNVHCSVTDKEILENIEILWKDVSVVLLIDTDDDTRKSLILGKGLHVSKATETCPRTPVDQSRSSSTPCLSQPVESLTQGRFISLRGLSHKVKRRMAQARIRLLTYGITSPKVKLLTQNPANNQNLRV